jgi:hypothetical protein
MPSSGMLRRVALVRSRTPFFMAIEIDVLQARNIQVSNILKEYSKLLTN